MLSLTHAKLYTRATVFYAKMEKRKKDPQGAENARSRTQSRYDQTRNMFTPKVRGKRKTSPKID